MLQNKRCETVSRCRHRQRHRDTKIGQVMKGLAWNAGMCNGVPMASLRPQEAQGPSNAELHT